jgi:putative FmdB family regulatory protein
MPIYEFLCPECGDRFEELTSAGTDSAECPRCGSAQARRVLSAPARPKALAMSPGEARRAEDRRGVDRGGAKQRFKKQLARERRARGGGGGRSGG